MRITCFIKSFAYILFACTLVVQGCSVPSSTAPLIHDIYELRNEHKFNEIIDIHDSYEWSTETDPQRLILYLEAASRTNIDIKARMKAEDAVISQFISGYEDLLFGETHRARTQFENIVRASEHKVWGYVGLLEYSVYINNTNSLYKYLEVLNEFSDINWINKWAKPYYAFQYYYLTNQYNNSLQEIKDYQYPDDYIDYQVIEILIRQNKIERAIEWFSHARNMHGNSISMVEAEANLIATRAGYNKSIKYIENILMHEDSWDIRQVYAFHLLDSDSDESDVRAGKLIYELALERSNDLREIIVAANILFDLGMDYYVSELLELINSRASPPTDMSHYRLLLAKIDRYEGHIHSMHNNIAAAFEISPNDPFINWFRYQIAQDMGDTDAALKVLHKLEEYDPYNQYTLYEKMKIYTELQEWNRVIELGERILSQERHIEQHIKHEIIQLRTLASRKIE